MKNIIFLIIILLLIPTKSSALNLNNLKSKAKKDVKKVEKKITKKIKPLTIDMKVSDVSYNPIKSLNTLTITIDFNGKNPNKIGITFNKTEFELFANNSFLAKFYNEKTIKITKNGPFYFQEKAEISLLTAGKTIFNAIIKKNAIYTIIGRYFINTPFGEFSFDAKLAEKEVNKKEVK